MVVMWSMDGFHRAVHIYMGNKTVGAVKKMPSAISLYFNVYSIFIFV